MKKTTLKTMAIKNKFDICFSVCRSCVFWLEDIEIPRVGLCVRYAPRPYYEVYSTCAEAQEKREKGDMRWPETKATDVCGEWQPIEEYSSVEPSDDISF